MKGTAADFLTEDEAGECLKAGIDPHQITVETASHNDGPDGMRAYDEVIMTIPAGFRRAMANHQSGEYTGYGYAPKVIKEAILGYW